MLDRGRQLIRAYARLAASRAVLVLAAFVILLGVVRGGTRFFYCPITHLAFDAPPCSQGLDETSTDDDGDAPAVRTADCCQEKWRAAAPTASTPEVPRTSIARAAVAALLPAPPRGMELVSARMPFEIAHGVRAGPTPPSARERRAELMVFHN